MKNSKRCTLAAAFLLIIVGCATEGQKPETTKDTRPIEQRLRAGMTKDEVRRAVGNPAGTSVNSTGHETWRYTDTGKAFIPFYAMSGGKFRHLIINFDAEGKVKDWASG